MTEQTDCLIVKGLKLKDKQCTVWSVLYNVHMNCCVKYCCLCVSQYFILISAEFSMFAFAEPVSLNCRWQYCCVYTVWIQV